MFQPDLTTYLEAIKQQYDQLLQENKMLKQENKKLMELNLEYKRTIHAYTSLQRSTNIIKMGSDWTVEGNKLHDIHLIKKFYFRDISYPSITNDNILIFISNNVVYILEDNMLYHIINDQIILYEDYNNKRFKSDSKRGLYNGNDIRSTRHDLLYRENRNVDRENKNKMYGDKMYSENRNVDKMYGENRNGDRGYNENRSMYNEKIYNEKIYNDKQYNDKQYIEKSYGENKNPYSDKNFIDKNFIDKQYNDNKKIYGENIRYTENQQYIEKISYDKIPFDKVPYDKTRVNIKYVIDDDNNLNVFQSNFLKKYNLKEKKLLDTINMPNHISMVIKNRFIYLTCYDKSFRIYDNDKLVNLLNSPEDIKSNLIVINNIGYSMSSKNNLIIFDTVNKQVKINKIFKMDSYDKLNRLYTINNMLLIKNNSTLVYYNLRDSMSREEIDGDSKEVINGEGCNDNYNNINENTPCKDTNTSMGINSKSVSHNTSNQHNINNQHNITSSTNKSVPYNINNQHNINTPHNMNTPHILNTSSNNIIKELDLKEDINSLTILNNNISVSNKETISIFDTTSNKKMYLKIKDYEIKSVHNNRQYILIEGYDMLRMYEYN